MITDFRLQLFVAVARELSFTRAAEEFNISQPAVTKHIKELERLLSVSLFRRRGNTISLTEQGDKLLPLASGVLQSYSDLNDAMSVESGDYSGRLRVGASTTIAQYILPNILARFSLDYPNVDVVLVGGNSANMLRGVEMERLDLALVEDAHTLSAFHYEHFADDRIVLVTANAPHRSVKIEELTRLPLVLRENGSGTLDVIERELGRCGVSRRELNVQIQIGSSEGIVRYLKASKCYAFISRSAVADYVARCELHIIDIEGVTFDRKLRFATLHGSSSLLVDIFKEYCLRHL